MRQQGQLAKRRISRHDVHAQEPVAAPDLDVMIQTGGQPGQCTAPGGYEVDQARQLVDLAHKLSKSARLLGTPLNEPAKRRIVGPNVGAGPRVLCGGKQRRYHQQTGRQCEAKPEWSLLAQRGRRARFID